MELPKNLNKFVLSSAKNESKAQYVLFGVPESRGSSGLARFEGSAKGPASLRKSSQLYCAFHRTENKKLETFITNSYKAINNDFINFFDSGDKKKSEVAETVYSLLKQKKFPIILGGDHSITYEILKGVNRQYDNFAVVYFDAHPDFRSSKEANRKSFATIIWDAAQLPHLKIKNSIQVGVRDIELEEFINMKKTGVVFLSSLDIENIGIHETLKIIKKTVGNLPFYISVDLDVLDQSCAPAVSTPSPFGLSSRELLFLLTALAGEKVIGLDIMEHAPIDENDLVTSTIGARLIIEFVVRHEA